MKTKIYLATMHGVRVIEGTDGKWRAEVRLEGEQVQCIAVDSKLKEVLYCGTFGNGVFRSDDAGTSWRPSSGLTNQRVMSLATSDNGVAGTPALLYAGTEPSAVYRSNDGAKPGTLYLVF